MCVCCVRASVTCLQRRPRTVCLDSLLVCAFSFARSVDDPAIQKRDRSRNFLRHGRGGSVVLAEAANTKTSPYTCEQCWNVASWAESAPSWCRRRRM